MSSDPNRHADNRDLGDGDGERVVVRDRRRVDPVTGAVRNPDSAEHAGSGGVPASPEVPADDPRVAELTAEVTERTADLQRLSAEYANYRRRVERDREQVQVAARAQFVGELLTLLDDIERAGAHGDLTGPFKAVADKLVSVVQKLGLEPFGVVGEPFDPSVHEAVQHEVGEVAGPSVTVLSAVLRRGYRIGDRVLRPAMVAVTDRADDDAGPTDPDTAVPDTAADLDDPAEPTGRP